MVIIIIVIIKPMKIDRRRLAATTARVDGRVHVRFNYGKQCGAAPATRHRARPRHRRGRHRRRRRRRETLRR